MKSRPAFTLPDALLGLMVLALTCGLIQAGVRLVNQQGNLSLAGPTGWYEGLYMLESDRYCFSLEEVQPQAVFLRAKDGRSFHLAPPKTAVGALALLGGRGGYVPLILNVERDTLTWKKLNSRELLLRATTKDGEQHETILQFAPPAGECPADGDAPAGGDHDGNPL